MGNQLAKRETVSSELVEVITPSGKLLSLEGKDGMYQLAEREVTVPADLVYKIQSGQAGFLASFYDLASGIMGLQFGDPRTTYEDKDRVRVVVDVKYWNRQGKLVSDSEEYEVDTLLLYEKARFGWQEKKWDKTAGKYIVTEEAKIKVIRDDNHPENPPTVYVTLPDKGEADIYENFLTLRRNKLAKAITCAHRRLTQRALGIKKFEANTNSDGWDKAVKIKMFSILPAEADRKVGIQAVADITGEEPTEKETKKTDPKPEKKAEKPAEKTTEQPEEKPALEKKEEKTEKQEEQTGDANNTCACGAVVEGRVLKYSLEKLGKAVCYNCQHPKKEKE